MPLDIYYGCTAWFVSDQVGNQNVGFHTLRLIYDFKEMAWWPF